MAVELPKLSGKRKAWFAAFTNADDAETFMNRTASAKAAKYRAKSDASFAAIGSENFRLLKDHVDAWLDEAGLSEAALKAKLLEGLEAMKTIYATHEGKIADTKDCIDFHARCAYLRLAMQAKGMLVEKKEVSGPGGKPIEHDVTGNAKDFARALMDEVNARQREGVLPNLTQEMIDPDTRPGDQGGE